MAIAFRTNATTTQTAVAHTFQPTLTIPASVASGDLLLVGVNMFTFTPTGPDITLSPAVGSWTVQGGGLQSSGASGGVETFGRCWSRVATGSDASSVLTFAFTGTQGGTDQFWWAIALGAWTGVLGGVDVAGGAAGLNTDTTPTVVTTASGDWGVSIGAIAVPGNGTITSGPTGTTTSRANVTTAGINLGLFDSNASVGSSGTSVGGHPFGSSSGGTGNWWADFTVTLSPVAPAAPAGTLLAAWPA